MKKYIAGTLYLLFIFLVSYITPLISGFAENEYTILVKFFVIPFVCFMVSLLYQLRQKPSIIYCVVLFIGFFPWVFVFYSPRSWMLMSLYVGCGLLATAIATFFYKKTEKFDHKQ